MSRYSCDDDYEHRRQAESDFRWHGRPDDDMRDRQYDDECARIYMEQFRAEEHRAEEREAEKEASERRARERSAEERYYEEAQQYDQQPYPEQPYPEPEQEDQAMSDKQTPGRRVYPDADGKMWYSPGDYGRDPNDGNWYGRPPEDGVHTGNFTGHTVVEHEDGTITVSPSILITQEDVQWHGFLERGVWRKC